MRGELIQARRGPPIGAIVCALGSAAALVLAYVAPAAWERWPLITLPLLGVALLLTRRPRFAARFEPDALVQEQPVPERIDYPAVVHVAAGAGSGRTRPNRRPVGELTVRQEGHAIHVPARLNLPPGLVLEQLLARVGFGGRRGGGTLEHYRRAAADIFGADKVYSYAARRFRLPWRNERRLAVGLALLAGSLAAAISVRGAVREEAGIVLSGWGMIIGAAFLIASAFRPVDVARKGLASELVVTPAGFALSQFEVTGELKWGEVRAIRYGRVQSPGTSMTLTPIGLLVAVEGAQVGIADIYDRPLQAIMRVMTLFWKGQATCDACGRTIGQQHGPACERCGAVELSATAAESAAQGGLPAERAQGADNAAAPAE